MSADAEYLEESHAAGSLRCRQTGSSERFGVGAVSTVEAEQPTAQLVHDGNDAISIDAALEALGPLGKHGATEAVEGAVWRVERDGRVDFLTKWVRPDKRDGRYLTGTANSLVSEPIWPWKDED